jgi:hypothetical protein
MIGSYDVELVLLTLTGGYTHNPGNRDFSPVSNAPHQRFKRNHSRLNWSSLEIVPSARHAARFERFAITGDVLSDDLTKMTASLAFVKNTLSTLLCGPYPC